jgi:hypothetical protein
MSDAGAEEGDARGVFSGCAGRAGCWGDNLSSTFYSATLPGQEGTQKEYQQEFPPRTLRPQP